MGPAILLLGLVGGALLLMHGGAGAEAKKAFEKANGGPPTSQQLTDMYTAGMNPAQTDIGQLTYVWTILKAYGSSSQAAQVKARIDSLQGTSQTTTGKSGKPWVTALASVNGDMIEVDVGAPVGVWGAKGGAVLRFRQTGSDPSTRLFIRKYTGWPNEAYTTAASDFGITLLQ
jgi:hypothetical protein